MRPWGTSKREVTAPRASINRRNMDHAPSSHLPVRRGGAGRVVAAASLPARFSRQLAQHPFDPLLVLLRLRDRRAGRPFPSRPRLAAGGVPGLGGDCSLMTWEMSSDGQPPGPCGRRRRCRGRRGGAGRGGRTRGPRCCGRRSRPTWRRRPSPSSAAACSFAGADPRAGGLVQDLGQRLAHRHVLAAAARTGALRSTPAACRASQFTSIFRPETSETKSRASPSPTPSNFTSGSLRARTAPGSPSPGRDGAGRGPAATAGSRRCVGGGRGRRAAGGNRHVPDR